MCRQRRRRLHDAGPAKTMYRKEWQKKAKQMGMAFSICSYAQGIEACEESHPRHTNLELKLVYVIRAPGGGNKPAPQFLSTSDHGSRRPVGYVALSGFFSGGAG